MTITLGGITVTESATNDERVDAVVALSQGNSRLINKVDVPIQFQGGCFDIGTWSILIVMQCYNKASTPKELIAIQGGTHFGFSTALGPYVHVQDGRKTFVYGISLDGLITF